MRKLVLSEDGSVDIGTAQFVAWAIRIVASVMILQSSHDSLLALLMLIVGVTFTSAARHMAFTMPRSRSRCDPWRFCGIEGDVALRRWSF